MVSDTPSQNEGRKRKRPQFYGFTVADISQTSSLTSSNPSKSKKRETKKQSKKSSATEESVVALIQSAEQSRVPSPPRPDIQIGKVSHPTPEPLTMKMNKKERCQYGMLRTKF